MEPTVESIGPWLCKEDDRLDRRGTTDGGSSVRDRLEVHGDVLFGGQ